MPIVWKWSNLLKFSILVLSVVLYLQKNCKHENFISWMQQLTAFQDYGGPDRQEEQGQMLSKGHHKNWQNVELISWEVIVQKVALSSVRHQKAVAKIGKLVSLFVYCTAITPMATYAYLSCIPLLELQLETATNHHRSRAVLKFLVPSHRIMGSKPVTLRVILLHPDTGISVVKLINWLFST